MTREEFYNLQVGKWIYDKEYSIYGEVQDGPWSNWGCDGNKPHNGRHIVWDDGDRSAVGLEYNTFEEIEKYELSTIVPT